MLDNIKLILQILTFFGVAYLALDADDRDYRDRMMEDVR